MDPRGVLCSCGRLCRGAATQQQQGEEPDPDPTCGSVEDVLAVLRDDYRRAYFLTGDFTPGIYTEDCLFEDPTIKFRGLSRYSQNLGLLVPFFDSPSLELENIEKGSRAETKFVKATWKLRFIFKLQKAHDVSEASMEAAGRDRREHDV